MRANRLGKNLNISAECAEQVDRWSPWSIPQRKQVSPYIPHVQPAGQAHQSVGALGVRGYQFNPLNFLGTSAALLNHDIYQAARDVYCPVHLLVVDVVLDPGAGQGQALGLCLCYSGGHLYLVPEPPVHLDN